MGTLIKVLVVAILSILLSSCQFDLNLGSGEKGNGNVVNEDRVASESFTIVDASEGLDVVIIQGDNTSVKVEADENIINLIQTEISNNRLKIHTSSPVGWAKSKKVIVTLPIVTALESSSGADIEVEGELNSDHIKLDASSGSDIHVTLKANKVEASTSSGADIKIYGSTESLYANASSGSDIKASNLTALNAYAKASSGADISVNCTELLDAKSSSGGDIHYDGNPKVIDKKGSFGGDIQGN
ncbi:Putative auto-transporter adhesin, head GIN domain [Zhouia amylolytica]|uniref:Putative auto-transporter adhesin, head GIN domain n=1 Tax=Zhouia amylolytica TaxID=376730 RepID=A0A1I6V6C1_9FLAO|nr:head GIN domain-containing protein [Zhouia amylolytica]MCQ0110004.1 DUF2807 domain-containing protein [Zhouia amylolytica]SFT09176.1 Putative auto-transporter adhesin, head GIN domain [Zhouia amylolytica]